ncbi:MAG: hypothetical protein KIT16_10045 [Rhodospirillaceae bacterium]|nr:hypothetical protein [Rhodospirillaceae bacterium]
MRKFARLAAAVGIAGAFGLAAAPAFAGQGQCYDYYGRPVGGPYNTDHPNYGFINSVLARGGSCTGVVSPYTPGPGNSYYHRQGPNYRYDRPHYQPRRSRREERERPPGYRYRYPDRVPNYPQQQYEITR